MSLRIFFVQLNVKKKLNLLGVLQMQLDQLFNVWNDAPKRHEEFRFGISQSHSIR